ncbi:MAG: DUF4911 domain-containing protein [Desulfovibrio sp.]|jgi:hypothetical protein|nr:DUF4911 domain-containing protein [Desulfovibrio sp.]
MESDCLLVTVERGRTAMFRFLLEAHENLAYFTVLERGTALLKVIFAPQQRTQVLAALEEISAAVPLQIKEWPASANRRESCARQVREIRAGREGGTRITPNRAPS